MAGRVELELPLGERLTLRVVDLNDEAVSGHYEGELSMPVDDLPRLNATLYLDDLQFAFKAQIIRYAKNFLVFKYCDYDEETYKEVLEYFPVILGRSLEDRGAQSKTSDWIHGSNYTDIFIQNEEDRSGDIHSLTYVSEDNYLHWNRETGMKTGQVKRETFAEGLGFSKRVQNPIIKDARPDAGRIKRLASIVAHSSLPVETKQAIAAILEIGS